MAATRRSFFLGSDRPVFLVGSFLWPWLWPRAKKSRETGSVNYFMCLILLVQLGGLEPPTSCSTAMGCCLSLHFMSFQTIA